MPGDGKLDEETFTSAGSLPLIRGRPVRHSEIEHERNYFTSGARSNIVRAARRLPIKRARIINGASATHM